jgi:hypothetical protein
MMHGQKTIKIKVDQKYLERFEIWLWGRMEKVS